MLGLASRISSRPPRAYSLSFDHADYDERALAEEQAKLSGAEFFPIDIRSEHMAEQLSDAVYNGRSCYPRRPADGGRPSRPHPGHAARGGPGRTGLYDRKRTLALLDRIPAMDAAARTSAIRPLWITSTCLLHQRLGL